MKRTLPKLKRIVVKIGSSSLCHENGKINPNRIESLVDDISQLIQQGIQVVLVSSGAVAAGRHLLNEQGTSIENKQAAAAIGQPILLGTFQRFFIKHNLTIAQVLLTHDDLHDRQRYLSARNTLENLLDHGLVPIINENDTISTEEIQFSDNDFLAALCTNLVSADLFIILSNIDGIGEKDPKTHPETDIYETLSIEKLEQLKMNIPKTKLGTISRGGIFTKLEAPIMAAQYGIPTIIANSQNDFILKKLLEFEPIGTFIQPTKSKLNSKKAFIAHALKPKAKLIIDQGAAQAICRKKASLLPSGIIKTEGAFSRGDGVMCLSPESEVIARGIVEYDQEEINLILGKQSSEIESILGFKHHRGIIHRDNMVIIKEK
ncbi:MAG: glutamate 5-kinase [Candidatus Marinimicrobia bacterium]|jgi:glutamate 5-kinase|nr:glutamate 5-kinase [Candidatus Neomarinimicrobiota bacterium]MBT3502608.1 glutamate 5-kinase [Candidatus Neomarinimicrobiota bacterium]MBT3839262.1 glutamate 5-kinase [Candidatus Neomarinimicrobiota bacterium]MBT3999223.1 glutamate 5-kinase [Candidatus Neomarinimicrobiota bacterium]MBT4281923.1 glutamate 5-kinase [Candidatus Neomarinimicrobiota bacterium]